MKLGPWEINISKSRTVTPMETNASDTTLYLVDHGSRRHPTKIQVMARKPHTVESIIFPAPIDPNDPWERLRFQKLVKEIAKWWERQSVTCWDITTAVREFNLQMTPQTQDSLEKLQLIQGNKFSELEQEIYESIPHLVTHIFTEGRVPPPWMRQPEDQPTDVPRLGRL